MRDAYSVLGIQPGADEETIKKAYRQKCKQYHPDLHPDDPTAEEKFKEVQAAYSEIMRERSGGGSAGGTRSGAGASGGYDQYQGQQGDPFGYGGFGFGPFGFGYYSNAGANGGSNTYSDQREGPELQAAGNYIRNGYYQEALNVLNNIPEERRSARWHYYAALANSGLGNNIRAQSEARMAVDMEPNNYQYQNLLDRLQHPGAAYSSQQQQHAQPGGGMCHFCITLWMVQMFCSFLNLCCCRPF
ncbi:MAG: DnaJ domain-containing protein [Gemmiger sp.]